GALRERVLTSEEIKVLWPWLDDLPPDYRDALRLQLLLGARIGEVAGMRREEIDQQNWTWRLPPERSKNGKPRVTPLVGLAREMVEARLGSRGPLFTTEGGAPLKASHIGVSLAHREKRRPIAHFTSHDLRRTVATGLADLGISLDLVAAVLGHDAGNARTRTLTRHYVRTDAVDRKRIALEAWDAHLRVILAGETDRPANVVSITAASR
ncbi:site-specific integrase, partial [Nostoc sp. NIES-2111]